MVGWFWLHQVFVAALGLYSSCSKQGPLFVDVLGGSHCSGFSCCGAQALGAWASVVGAHRLSTCDSWALEYGLSSCSFGL